ncbi:hypothetical protein NDU88_008401 [Pleurodeles waltl]|uniref:Uncharacterized protein n=1 Tax=Pleurodeles waltl TaxID=8319 RepID=A0AAV7RVL8_PLEWA|nr:hypothetical protein NDU88_008401 [Pleurodeles waltl]
MPGAGTPGYPNGSLLPDQDPGGTAGSEPEDTPLGNTDIRVPVTEKGGARPWRAEEDARNQAEEDDTGDPEEETDARGEEKVESETGETGERHGEEPHMERSYLGQLTTEGSPEEVHLNPLSPDPLTILIRFKELRTKPQLTIPSFLPWQQRFPTRTSAGPRGPEREKKKERMLH